MPNMWEDIIGAGIPYAAINRGQVGADPNRGYAQSPSGPQGASMQSPTPQQSPTSWMDQLQKMLQGATTGLDTARTGIQGMFGQQQPRTIETTDPGAGYGQSPSGPTARLGSAQFPMSPQQAPRDLQPYRGAGSNVGSFRGVPAVTSGQVSGYMATPQARSSPSAPWAQEPARQQPQARPRQNVTEQFSVPANYGSSPSNPNWQPRKPMSPLYEPPRPPVGGP